MLGLEDEVAQTLFRGGLRLGGLRGTGRLSAELGGRHREENEEAK